MTNSNGIHICTHCGVPGGGNYCSQCGQPYEVKRITLHGLLHDVFHLFTHLDKGFPYTLKKLVTAPGHMQKNYIAGDRGRHQKPFSMFFICATATALIRYWIFQALLKYYNTGSVSEVTFFHEYLVVLHIVLLPVYVLLPYLLFYKSKYNYAEIGVMTLYTLAFFFIVTIIIALLKFIWPALDTAYVELPVLLIYNIITCINFFNDRPKMEVVLKSLLSMAILFFIVQKVEDFVVQLIS